MGRMVRAGLAVLSIDVNALVFNSLEWAAQCQIIIRRSHQWENVSFWGGALVAYLRLLSVSNENLVGIIEQWKICSLGLCLQETAMVDQMWLYYHHQTCCTRGE